MFLDILNNEEKELFLDLAIKAAEANGEVAKEEKEMLHAFAYEMKIKSRFTSTKSLADVLNVFKEKSSKRSMRIVAFELIGILFADSEFDDAEKAFLSDVTNVLEIPESIINEMLSEITDYSAIYKKICKTVL